MCVRACVRACVSKLRTTAGNTPHMKIFVILCTQLVLYYIYFFSSSFFLKCNYIMIIPGILFSKLALFYSIKHLAFLFTI